MFLSSVAFIGMAYRVPVVSLLLRYPQTGWKLTPMTTAKTTLPRLNCPHYNLRHNLLLRHGYR
jgi:hypothetical protein